MTHVKYGTLLFLAATAASLWACGGTSEELEAPIGAGRHALVSDWLNHRLDLIDIAKLEQGAGRDDALIKSLDLSAYEQGPLNAEVTPDGKLALVSLSDGFFGLPFAGSAIGATSVPNGPGRVLFIDLDSFEVAGEVLGGDGPMGISFVENATKAVIPHFGQENLTVVDIATRQVVEEVPVGIYGEEIAVDDSGEVGIFSYSAAGNVRTFATDDVTGTLSAAVELEGDAAGVAFFPGTKIAYVVQTKVPVIAVGGHSVIDVSDPASPVVLEDFRSADSPVAYPAAPVPDRGSVVVPTANNGTMQLLEIELTSAGTINLVQTIPLGTAMTFGAYGAVVDENERVLLSVPGQKKIVVADLVSGTAYDVPWDGAGVGPIDIALLPETE